MKAIIRSTLILVVSGALLWYVLKDINVSQLQTQFRQTYYSQVVWLLVIVVIGNVMRAQRWRLALAAMDYKTSLLTTTIALVSGSLVSMVIPGAGELTRCGTLERTDKVPFTKGIGSVIIERAVDLLMLGVLMVLTFLITYNRLSTYFFDVVLTRISGLFSSGYSWLAFSIIFLSGFLFYRFLSRNRHRFSGLSTILGGIRQGLFSLQRLQHPYQYVILTLLIYGCSYLTMYTVCMSSPRTAVLGPEVALAILTVSALGGLAVPTQGGVGTFHLLAQLVLVLYGYSAPDGALLATYMHAILMGVNLLVAVVGFVWALMLAGRRLKPVQELV